MASPRDDEVSQEIRTLQLQLRTCVEDTNEAKRKLRKIMDEYGLWRRPSIRKAALLMIIAVVCYLQNETMALSEE